MSDMMTRKVEMSVGNIVWIIGAIFIAGGIYARVEFGMISHEEESEEIRTDIEILDQRLEKKIKLINDNEARIRSLEIKIAEMDACK